MIGYDLRTEPELTEALYVLYIHTFNNIQIVHTDKRLIIADCD
jgi:hypothetical protein